MFKDPLFKAPNVTSRELCEALDGTHPDVLKSVIPCVAQGKKYPP